MTPERLQQIEATLTAKLFPHGGFEEVRELVEAVRGYRLALVEIDDLLKGQLPITKQVKEIARTALGGTK